MTRRNKHIIPLPQFEAILSQVSGALKGMSDPREALGPICKILAREVPYYNWVGFYLVDSQNPQELILGPFVGEPTEHVRIPFGAGICGQAAERKKIFIVQDVSSETNYLSCSPNVRSEIVLPILKDGILVGELDIDSHFPAPFTREDEDFLQRICDLTAAWLDFPLHQKVR